MKDGVMERGELVLLYVIGVCEGLVAKGMLEGGKFKLAPGGRETYERLRAEGFRPTDDEMRAALAFLQSDASNDVFDWPEVIPG